MSWSLRPATPEDDAFLFRVYFHTRAAEMSASGWPLAQVEAFLRSQFELRERQYRLAFPQGTFEVVLAEGVPVGRVASCASAEASHLIDFALLPECQGQGLGTRILKNLLARSEQKARIWTLQVDRQNRARKLYERLGFCADGGDEIYLSMRLTRPSRT